MINVSEKVKDALLSPMRFIKYKVEVYFDNNVATNITDDIMGIDTLDETTDNTLPFGAVTYNELNIQLDNMTKKYTITNEQSPYNGKLIAGKKVVLTYLVEVSDGVFEPVTGGVYYTDDWRVSTDSNTATLLCYDRISLVGSQQVNKFKVASDITIVDAYKQLFNERGIEEKDYVISSEITGKLPYFWSSSDNFRSCLSDLSLLTKTVVFVDKQNRINVVPMVNAKVPNLSLSDDSLIMNVKSEPSYNNVYSGIRIKYNIVVGNKIEEVYRVEDYTLNPGINTIVNELFETSPVIEITGIKIISSVQCKVIDYDCTDNAFSLTINNTTSKAAKATIIIEGNLLQTVANTYFMERAADTNNILEITLPLASTQEYVESYATGILELFSRYVSSVEVSMIGYPAIDIYDNVYLDSKVVAMQTNMQIIRITHAFNNGMETTAVLRYI